MVSIITVHLCEQTDNVAFAGHRFQREEANHHAIEIKFFLRLNSSAFIIWADSLYYGGE
jgi:hypothetical protein